MTQTQTQKQTRGQHADFQPSEPSAIRMAVIEWREDGYPEWSVWETYGDICQQGVAYLQRSCVALARRWPTREFRYRYGSLILENSDNCETFKSE